MWPRVLVGGAYCLLGGAWVDLVFLWVGLVFFWVELVSWCLVDEACVLWVELLCPCTASIVCATQTCTYNALTLITHHPSHTSHQLHDSSDSEEDGEVTVREEGKRAGEEGGGCSLQWSI